jgi:hypothetical protein
MTNLPGTIPPAKDRAGASRPGKVLYPFDGSSEVLEKRGAPPRYSAVIWPFLVGLALAVIAPKLMDMLDSLNPWINRAVFPFVLLVRRPEFGLSWDFGGELPRLILLAQFPLEGLLTTFNLRRRYRLSVAIAQLIVIHMVGAFVLLLLIQAQGR